MDPHILCVQHRGRVLYMATVEIAMQRCTAKTKIGFQVYLVQFNWYKHQIWNWIYSSIATQGFLFKVFKNVSVKMNRNVYASNDN